MKTVLITGASRGIGKATAELFAENGYNVVINYNHSEKEAMELAHSLNSSIAIKADVSDPSEVRKMVKTAVEKFGSIDVLVNNAGISKTKLFIDALNEDFRQVFDTNFMGTVNTTREVLPYMIDNRSGSIINVSSIWGIKGAANESIYSASKAAILGLTKSLAKEYSLMGIRVNAVAPGFIETEMNSCYSSEDLDIIRDEIPVNKFGKPSDVAKLIYFLAENESEYINGQTIGVDGGWSIA